MKKVLFASTALVAWAGVAAAQDTDIVISGVAELGVLGGDLFEDGNDDNFDFDDTDIQFHTDIDVTFTMTGQTDTGLTFGANIDLDEVDAVCDSDDIILVTDDPATPNINEEQRGTFLTGCSEGNAFNPRRQGGESIFISGAFGTLTMGDTDGAFDWALSEAIIGSALNDDHEHAGYSGNAGLDGLYDGQVARYEYAFSDFAVAVSGEIDDLAGGDDEDAGDDAGDPVLGLGVRYATDFAGVAMAFGGGVQTVSGLGDIADDVIDIIDDEDDNVDDLLIWGLSADATFAGGFQVIANYSDLDDLGEHWGVAGGYSIDALTIAANYGQFDTDFGDSEGYGVVANYDLGGGAELQAGYGHNTFEDLAGDESDSDTFSLGVAMAF